MFALFLEIDDKATILQCPSKAYLIQDFLGDSQSIRSGCLVLISSCWSIWLSWSASSAYPTCLAELTVTALACCTLIGTSDLSPTAPARQDDVDR